MQPVVDDRSINVKMASCNSHLLNLINMVNNTSEVATKNLKGKVFIELKMKQIEAPLQYNKIGIKHNHTLMQTTQQA